jgi:hypothetical protein
MLRTFAPLLGCALMMLVCVVPMALRNRRGSDADTPASSDEIASLRAEVARLGALNEPRRTVDGPAS